LTNHQGSSSTDNCGFPHIQAFSHYYHIMCVV
jgi:hypothetical protein